MEPLHPAQELFQLACAGRAEPAHVVSFRGREEISALYRTEIRITVSESPEDVGAALLGQRVALLFRSGGEVVRVLHGLALHVESHGAFLGERHAFAVTVGPALARLKRRRTRRIFQHRSTLEIAAELLAEHRVLFRVAARERPEVRDYTVQYDETDLAFLTRLLAEDGLFYFFEHPLSFTEGDSEILVIAGGAEEYPPIAGPPTLRFDRLAGEGALLAPEDRIGWFVAKDRSKSRHARNRAHDFRRPDTDIRDEALAPGTAPLDLAILDEHAGSFEDDPGLRPARIRLEQERRKARTAEGTSACRRLVPGHQFLLEGHELRFLDQGWTVSRVDHEGTSAEVAKDGQPHYRNRFEVLPSGVPARPRFVPPRPRQVAETAVVVGPRGEEIHTDPHGRIKVQFHWDLEGRHDEKSSCYLRVAHAWADAGWGAQFIPRIGSEVVVTYLGGDVDRPLVTGCVYNATHPHPFNVPEQKTRSGFRTRSTPSGQGSNELSFEDALGREEVYLRAERNYREVVRHDRASRVDGNSSREVAGETREVVGASASLQVGVDRTTRIGHDETLHVGGRAETSVAGDSSLRIEGSRTVDVNGKASTHVRRNTQLVVGTATAPAQSDQFVHGSTTIASTERTTLRAGKGLRLECGESAIELFPDKIVLTSKTIEVTPTVALECGTRGGPTVTLAKDVEILSSKLRVFTEGGALEIDQDFKAKGASIQLGYSPDKPSRDRKDEEKPTKPFSCKLSNYFLKPYARKTYHVLACGLRFEGKTDGDGWLHVNVPAEAKQVTVRLWLDAFPEGRQRVWNFALSEKPPERGVRGAKLRLKNLGYYTGPVDDHIDERFRIALAEMQSDHADSHALRPTGELDEGTEGALEEIHEH